MFRINIERHGLSWKYQAVSISLSLLIIISLIAHWSFYIYRKNLKRAESPEEAIDLEEKSFFLSPQLFKNYTLTTNDSTENATKTECKKVCPEKYFMSADCEYCFLFGEWRSKTGDRVLLNVEKDHAVKFCKMYSNGWLPNRQEDLYRIWENPILVHNFAPPVNVWFGGSWDVETKRYRSDLENKTIENVRVNLPSVGNIRKSLDKFYFRWLENSVIGIGRATSIAMITNHLNWTSTVEQTGVST